MSEDSVIPADGLVVQAPLKADSNRAAQRKTVEDEPRGDLAIVCQNHQIETVLFDARVLA
jgi:hypothetical protein